MTRIIIALLVGAAGIALTLAGLGVDAWLHAQDETLAAREGIFTLSNPGHALLAAGMTLACAGIIAALYFAWGMSKARGMLGRRWVRVLSMQAAGVAGAGTVLFALATSASGHQHAAGDVLTHTHEEAKMQPVVEQPGVEALAGAALPESHQHADQPIASAPSASMSDDQATANAAEPPAHAHAEAPAPVTDAPLVAASNDSPPDGMHMHDAMDMGEASTAATATHGHPRPTAEELACMADLTAQAKAATTRFDDFSVAVAEGYVTNQLDPSKTHHPNRAYKRDGVIFDLSKPESLIYVTQDDGSKRFVGVLYHAPVGQGPTPCGAATFWHTHGQCIDATGAAIPETKDKTCPEGMEHRDGNVEMMHLWFVPRGQRS